jgi:hypothetical protein
MSFPEAIAALSRGRDFMAVLVGGPRLVMNAGGAIIDVRGHRPYRYVGKFSDFVSIEWQVFSREQLERLAAKAAAEAMEAEQAEQKG